MKRTFIKIGADKLVDANEVETPVERVFREAWDLDSTNSNLIIVDMEKAKDIWRDKIRHARKDVFPILDTAFIRALETGADTSDIVLQKQILRDAPSDPRIDSASTPEELKTIKPDNLVIE